MASRTVSIPLLAASGDTKTTRSGSLSTPTASAGRKTSTVDPGWHHGDPVLRVSKRDEVVAGGLDGAHHEVRTQGAPRRPDEYGREAVEGLVDEVLPGHDRLPQTMADRVPDI